MPTIRQHRRHHFTIVPNSTAEDRRLSFRARGLLAYLLAKPDGWTPRMAEIESAATEGREAVRAAVAELEACGYISREQTTGTGGRLDWIWTVRDEPGDGSPGTGTRPRSDLGEHGNPQVAPRTGNRPTVGRPSSKTHKQDSLEADPAAPSGDGVKALARDLAKTWYDGIKARTGRAPLQGFIAAASVIEKAVAVGYDQGQIAAALGRLDTVAAWSLQRELDRITAVTVNRPAEAYRGTL